MALALTKRLGVTTSGNPHGTGSFTTSSFTPSSNSLLVVLVGVQTNGVGVVDDTLFSITDSVGLTWTKRAAAGSGTFYGTHTIIWTAPVSTGASMTITVDGTSSNDSVQRFFVSALDLTGYDTGSPIGATGTYIDASGHSSAAVTLTLSGAPASTSYVLAMLTWDNGGAVTGVAAGSGWTEEYNHGPLNTYADGHVESRTGSTSDAVAWASHTSAFYNVGAAIEIKEASAGVAMPVLAHHYRSMKG